MKTRKLEWILTILLVLSLAINDFKYELQGSMNPLIFDYFLFLVVGLFVGYYLGKQFNEID
jgi:hypothetical protein